MNYMGSGKQADLTRFKMAGGEVRRAVRSAKNAWYMQKAEEV